MSNRYRAPSIDASYQALVHLAKRFRRRRFFFKSANRYRGPSIDASYIFLGSCPQVIKFTNVTYSQACHVFYCELVSHSWWGVNQYNIMWSSLSVTCTRLAVFYRFSGFLHQKYWPQDINEILILLKVTLNTITTNLYTLNAIKKSFFIPSVHFFLYMWFSIFRHIMGHAKLYYREFIKYTILPNWDYDHGHNIHNHF